MNRPALRPLVWIVAAVAVTATATAVITASLLSDNSVRSPEEVDRALAGATSTPTGSTAPTGTATPTGTTTLSIGDSGFTTLIPGVVNVQCDGAVATLLSWSPNPGWRADDPMRGPAAEVSVRFESEYDADYKVTATCAAGEPTVIVGPDDEHGGGGRGPGGGGDD